MPTFLVRKVKRQMKLNNSEVLSLTQMLYHMKCSNYFEFSHELNSLHEKLNSHLIYALSLAPVSQLEKVEEVCMTHNDDFFETISDETERKESILEITIKDLLCLECINVYHDGDKKSLLFEKGITKSALDINLDDGTEILFDVTEIERRDNILKVETAMGEIIFNVQKFPKSWTALLLDQLYKVV